MVYAQGGAISSPSTADTDQPTAWMSSATACMQASGSRLMTSTVASHSAHRHRWSGGLARRLRGGFMPPTLRGGYDILPSSGGSLPGLIGVDAVLAQPRLEVGHPGPQPPELIRLPAALGHHAGLGHHARAGLGHHAHARTGGRFLLDPCPLLDQLLLRIAQRRRLAEVLDVDGRFLVPPDLGDPYFQAAHCRGSGARDAQPPLDRAEPVIDRVQQPLDLAAQVDLEL